MLRALTSSGWTSGTEDKVSERCCFALLKLKLSLAAACRSFSRRTVSRPQASTSALGYERKYAIEGRPKGYADIIYVKALRRTASSGA